MKILTLAALGALLLPLLAACGAGDDETTTTAAGGQLSGRIEADGSSTVAPFTTLAAERFQAQSPGVRVTVGVSGTGGGFERFYRADRVRASRGTGLGLAIVKHIVASAGGAVEARSARGHGLEIRCAFPEP